MDIYDLDSPIPTNKIKLINANNHENMETLGMKIIFYDKIYKE